MKKLSFVFVGMALVLSGCIHRKGGETSGLASNYPPDYPITSECKHLNGKIEICRRIGTDWVGLSIQYQNGLMNELGDRKLRVWLKVNGNDASFDMTTDRPEHGSPFASTVVSSWYHSCRSSESGSGWSCDAPTSEMKHVLFWSRPADHGFAVSNALDVQMAFNIKGTDKWDNNGGFGRDFRVRFDQYGH